MALTVPKPKPKKTTAFPASPGPAGLFEQLTAADPRTSGYNPVFRPGTPEFKAAVAHTPGWQQALGNAALNVLTIGEHSNPGTVRQYGIDTARSFDPRSPEGAFNLAATFAGGKGGGKLHTAQADLPTLLESAGVQPSSWITRSDPFLDAFAAHAGTKRQAGIARDPDSATILNARAGTHAGIPSYVAQGIGPRVVGGIYKSGYSGEVYRVLDIKHGTGPAGTWQIKIEPIDPKAAYNARPRWHATDWHPGKDQVLMQPKATAEATAYLTHLLGEKYNPNVHKPGG